MTVKLNQDPERTVVISITKTNQGGAVNGDYRGVPSSVTFNSGGDTEQTFTVTARPDDDNDDGESVKLTFGTLPDAVTASGATETTIEITDDDDPQVTVSFKESSYRVAEGGSVEVTVTLSADPERDVTVGISASGQGGATEQDNTGADYSGVPDSVMFRPRRRAVADLHDHRRQRHRRRRRRIDPARLRQRAHGSHSRDRRHRHHRRRRCSRRGGQLRRGQL